MALYIKKSTKKESIFQRLFKNFNDDDIFYAGGEATKPAPEQPGACACELVPPHWPSEVPEAKNLRLNLIFYMVVHVGFMLAHIFVINNLMFAIKEMLPLYICFYSYRTMKRFVLYFYCIMLMVSGALGIFSIFSIGTLSFLAIILYISQLAIYVLFGYRLFFLIGEFGDGLAKQTQTSKDIEKEGVKGGATIQDKVINAAADKVADKLINKAMETVKK